MQLQPPTTSAGYLDNDAMRDPLQYYPGDEDVENLQELRDKNLNQRTHPTEDDDGWLDEVVKNNEITKEQKNMIKDLNSSLYQSKRLENEVKWARAVQTLVDFYIIA